MSDSIPQPANIGPRKWEALDPNKAERRAIWGLRGPWGSTFLIHEDGQATAVGLFSSRYPACLAEFEREALSLATCGPGMTDMDRRIAPAVFASWRAAK